MLGAIIGDLAGSIYEFEQFNKVKKITIKNIIEKDSFYSDDTILTIAIADAIINKKDYGEMLKRYAIKYENAIPRDIPYFKTMFSPSFTSWAKGNGQGTSIGNGAMMRISPVGFLFNNESEIIENVYLATSPSHNTKESIDCATKVALIIFYARRGLSKKDIISKLNLEIKAPNITKFNYSCIDTIDVCLYSLFNSNSFEESIKKAISFGGDTDTNACIVGGMAEAMFGISNELKQKALSKLPDEFKKILEKCYEQIKTTQIH
jgi:ADP-ribosyl-[dinitrogen reductase] hydrolase